MAKNYKLICCKSMLQIAHIKVEILMEEEEENEEEYITVFVK
jgi:hypothetical protein